MIKNAVVKIVLVILLLSQTLSPASTGETVLVPGDVSRICYYTNFFYNFPSEDFLYYLNDRLLFTEAPDDLISKGRLRLPMLGVLLQHKIVKAFVQDIDKEKNGRIVFKLKEPGQLEKATELMKLLGRELKRSGSGKYSLKQLKLKNADYFQFSALRKNTLLQQMNRAHAFTYRLKETKLKIPFSMAFFSDIIGTKVTSETFFERLLKDKRLSLLLGILYRLSDREIQYIDKLDPTTAHGAWKQIYRDKKWLMGMFILSHSLRVNSDGTGLLVPGGSEALAFWKTLAANSTTDLKATPVQKEPVQKEKPHPLDPVKPQPKPKVMSPAMTFLWQLATGDDGKLNYLYTYGFFLPETSRKVLFSNYDAAAFDSIYKLISLKPREKLSISAFPILEDWNFFSLLYALKTESGKIKFPGGTAAWRQALAPQSTPDKFLAGGMDVLKLLLIKEIAGAAIKSPGKIGEMRKFMALYSKFSHRPELLAEGALAAMYLNYEKYNSLVDAIEKIPLKNPATVIKLFEWVHKLQEKKSTNRYLFTAIYQSLFEILACTAHYMPEGYDYDLLVNQLIDLPMQRSKFYPGLFSIFKKQMRVREKKRSLVDFMLSGLKNPMVKMKGARYRFMIKKEFRKKILSILQSQEGWRLSTFMKLNRLLGLSLKVKPPHTGGIGSELREVFAALQHPDIGSNAPKDIKDMVAPYSPRKLNKLVKNLVKKMHIGADPAQLNEIIDKIYSDFLIHRLKDHLMILAYAANVKEPGMKMFLNPNVVRFHHIGLKKARSLWDNIVPVDKSTKKSDDFSEYHLSGSLSRLNITLAPKWQLRLFRDNIIHNHGHVQAMIVNLMNLYPMPGSARSLKYSGLLVELGMELIYRCEQFPEDRVAHGEPIEQGNHGGVPDDTDGDVKEDRETDALRKKIRYLLKTRVSGYRYRRAMQYVDGKALEQNLFFSEFGLLGRGFLEAGYKTDKFDIHDQLKPFQNLKQAGTLSRENRSIGSSYFHTFGNLMPSDMPLFPQDLANFRVTGWLSGAMMNEFTFKLAHLLYKKKTPPELLGQLLYMYFSTTGKNFLRQNHVFDYPITYFMFDIINSSHLRRNIKKLEKSGYLKLN